MRLRRLPGALAAVLLLSGMVSSVPRAQGALIGRVTLVEQPGMKGRDLKSTVVWLVPVGAPAGGTDTIPRRASIAMRTREFLPRVRVIAAGGSVEPSVGASPAR
jgi:hypothetical protein